METVDLSTFMEETKSAGTIAYDHALELAYLAAEEMQRQGIKKEGTRRANGRNSPTLIQHAQHSIKYDP